MCLFFTPLGGWLTRGAGNLWQGFTNLPGIAWAREQMEIAPQSEEETGGTSGAASESLKALLPT